MHVYIRVPGVEGARASREQDGVIFLMEGVLDDVRRGIVSARRLVHCFSLPRARHALLRLLASVSSFPRVLATPPPVGFLLVRGLMRPRGLKNLAKMTNEK